MIIDLSHEEIEMVLTSLSFSAHRLADSHWADALLKENTLTKLQALSTKLRDFRRREMETQDPEIS